GTKPASSSKRWAPRSPAACRRRRIWWWPARRPVPNWPGRRSWGSRSGTRRSCWRSWRRTREWQGACAVAAAGWSRRAAGAHGHADAVLRGGSHPARRAARASWPRAADGRRVAGRGAVRRGAGCPRRLSRAGLVLQHRAGRPPRADRRALPRAVGTRPRPGRCAACRGLRLGPGPRRRSRAPGSEPAQPARQGALPAQRFPRRRPRHPQPRAVAGGGVSHEALRLRARLNRLVRDFFETRGVLEVETPVISRAGNTEPNIASFTVEFGGHIGDAPRTRWLRTSAEFPMKRLLAEGIGDCYELGRVFRDGEAGGRHNPEFTMLEWYRVGWTLAPLIDETAALVRAALALVGRSATLRTASFREVYQEALGLDPMTASLAE